MKKFVKVSAYIYIILAGYGNEINPTLEIVQVEGEFKFASTHYGVLSPLGQYDCNKPSVKAVMMDFLLIRPSFSRRAN